MLFDPPRFIGGLLGAWLPFVQGEGDGLGEAAAGKPPPMPAINQQVLLELQLSSTLYESRTFVTLVQEIDDDVIAVARPMSKTHYFPVRPGVGYKLRYVAPDSAYEIKGTVARVDLGEPGLVWLHREEVNRLQRRELLRVEVNLPVDIRLRPSLENQAEEAPPAQEQWFTARTLDLGGGGVALLTDLSLSVGDQVELKIPLDNAPLVVAGQVVRRRPERVVGIKILQGWGIRFVDLDPREQDRLVRFLFACQVRQRQREQGWRR